MVRCVLLGAARSLVTRRLGLEAPAAQLEVRRGARGSLGAFPRFQAARRCWQRTTGRFWMEFRDGFFKPPTRRHYSSRLLPPVRQVKSFKNQHCAAARLTKTFAKTFSQVPLTLPEAAALRGTYKTFLDKAARRYFFWNPVFAGPWSAHKLHQRHMGNNSTPPASRRSCRVATATRPRRTARRRPRPTASRRPS